MPTSLLYTITNKARQVINAFYAKILILMLM